MLTAPDWAIEILSPNQSSNRVAGNLLHDLKYGCQLGGLVDLDDRSVLVFQPQQQPELFRLANVLPVLQDLPLALTVDQLFSWLCMGAE